MAWNGSGLFSRLYAWATDAANGVDIDATRMDADTNDIVTGLNNALCKDGQNTPTANLPMGGYKHTGVADGSARNHYASVGQAQDGTVVFAVASGTANALTLAYTPVITALVDGMELRFRASATCAAGATTVAVNGIAAKSIKRPDGNDPASGDITNGREYSLRYNSSGTSFTLLGVGSLPTSGGTLTGSLQAAAGTSSAPGLAVGEANSGIYRVSSNVLAWVTNAVEVFRTAASGIITFAKAVRGTPASVSYSSTVTLDFATSNDFVIGSLTGNLTIANPSNVAVGQGGTIYTAQDATGSRTISFGTNWKKVGSASATTTASKVNTIAYSVPNSTSEILYSIIPQS